MTLRIGSLFSGYGGLDLGVQQVFGGEVRWHVEFDAAPSKILTHHWPATPNHGDVTAVRWENIEPVDVLTAGYPCQPFSVIGKRKGKDDERHLWPYVASAIRTLRPRLAVLENVAGHLTLGFGSVLGDLAEIGYNTRWVCIPASAAGAPHRRDRVFIAAYPKDQPWRLSDGDGLRPRRDQRHNHADPRAGAIAAPQDARTPDAVWGRYLESIRRWERVTGRLAPLPGHPGGGVTTNFTEWLMGLPAGHVTSPRLGLSREEQAKAIGNGVVPQQAALALRLLHEPVPEFQVA